MTSSASSFPALSNALLKVLYVNRICIEGGLLPYTFLCIQMTSTKLLGELSFYRRYHSNSVNVGIHILCIPAILITTIYGLTVVRLSASNAAQLGVNPELEPFINLGVLVGFYYWGYYTALDSAWGFTAGALVFLASIKLSALNAVASRSTHLISLGIWSSSWLAQFIGHGVFEKRAPALFSNLQQALVLAPYFALLEVLDFVGVRKGLMAEVDTRLLAEKK